MSYSYSYSESFAITHAKHMAAKVATDLKRMQRFYNSPSDESILKYEEEIIQLLKYGYLEDVTYGFKRNDVWIPPTRRYTARDLMSTSGIDDDPGRIYPGEDISGASFYSFLNYSSTWWDNLTSDQREKFKKNDLPFYRGNAEEPLVDGHFEREKTYSAGGKALDRFTVRRY